MKLNEYQSLASNTRLPTATTSYLYANLAAEAGEVLGKWAKGMRDGFPMDYEQSIKKELGDVLWQVSQLAIDHGFTLEDVAISNLEKLNKRKEENKLKGSGDER